MTAEPMYTIADLARLTGVNVRTIRYYLAQGLLPASGESGPGAHYDEGHLSRLRLTKRLQEQHLPLAEIRRRLAELTDAQAAELLAPAVVEEGEARQTSALEYVRNLLGQGSGGRTGPQAAPSSSAGETPVSSAMRAASAPPPASMTRRAKSMPFGTYLRAGPARARGAMPSMRDVTEPPPTDAAAIAAPSAPAGSTRDTEPQSHERSQWERLSLGPNVEIHIRRPLSRIEQRRVERLITIARQVLKEDKP